MINRKKIQDTPIDVVVDDGSVGLAGPDGAVVVLSPEAAEETSDRLWRGAMFAREQKRLSHAPDEQSNKKPYA